MKLQSAPVSAIASWHELNTGRPWTFWPPRPGVTPPTTVVTPSTMSPATLLPTVPVTP